MSSAIKVSMQMAEEEKHEEELEDVIQDFHDDSLLSHGTQTT